MLKFHFARLHTLTYLPTEFQADSCNTLDFYHATDQPTNQPTDQPTLILSVYTSNSILFQSEKDTEDQCATNQPTDRSTNGQPGI